MSPTAPLRILTIDDDALSVKLVEERLHAAGFVCLGLTEPTLAVPTAMSFRPDLILLDRVMPVLSGPEVIRSLRAFPQCNRIPVVLLTGQASEKEIVRASQSGAIEVFPKPFSDAHVAAIPLLIAENLSTASQDGPVRRLLATYRRSKRDGTLQLNPGTPFEGRIRFQGGELVRADYGPLEGNEAIEEMLRSVDEGTWRFVPDRPQPDLPPPSPAPTPGNEWRVLVVDDDQVLRTLFKAQLGRVGFTVELAEDGLAGFEAAIAQPFDLILADLNMPRLDGWGMLQRLKADHRTKEVPLVFLSAHDDYRETLKAAKAGAHDYLAKTGKAGDVVGRVQALLDPRVLALTELTSGKPVAFEPHQIGIQWLLRQLARLRKTGAMTVTDDWGYYCLWVREGRPVDAESVSAKRTMRGISALATLLVSRGGQGQFIPDEASTATRFTYEMDELLRRTCETLNQLDARATLQRIVGTTSFEVDPALYQLYRQVGSDRGVEIAALLCEQRMAPLDAAKRIGIGVDQVQETLRELLRRRVISFPENPPSGR